MGAFSFLGETVYPLIRSTRTQAPSLRSPGRAPDFGFRSRTTVTPLLHEQTVELMLKAKVFKLLFMLNSKKR